jgi:GMP synthase (glutamine-hydrolysing)
MDVLALVHGSKARSGVFGEVVRERGHRLEEWSLAWGTPPPRPVDDYGAVLVFGGSMHADQDDRHPWLREETLFLQRLLDLHMPVLGVCLGAQLLARAAHAPVTPAPEPEIGWYDLELTTEARHDPIFTALPRTFTAFEWHYYTYGVPAGAVELARSSVCTQAFRLGDAWGVQFHPEVTDATIASWIAEGPHELLCPRDELEAQTRERLPAWSQLGRSLCGAFCAVAERRERLAA